MSRNFGLGSRNMKDAGRLALIKKMQSFSSIYTMSDRWNKFVDWVKNVHGIGRMEKIDVHMVREYGEDLAMRVEAGHMAPATAQNYVSAVNRVMAIARRDLDVWVSPTKDCGIPERNGIAKENSAISPIDHQAAMNSVSRRIAVLLELQRSFGLRFEESAKLNARSTLATARANGSVSITDGTKGGRRREVLIISPFQLNALERAAELQGSDRSMIPGDQKYSEFRSIAYNEATRVGFHFHSERHAYAQNRYAQLAGALCPVAAGVKHGQSHMKWLAAQLSVSLAQAKKIDHETRQQIAEELGHGRIGITNAYLG